MTAILLQDRIYSERNKSYIQKAGTKVNIISIRDHVAVVENDKGHRFSILFQYLKINQ